MEDQNEKFVRWQKTAIDQLGYALHLTLTLTIGAIGYWFFLLTDKTFNPEVSAKCILILSLLALFISSACGLLCIFNRLLDFRGSARRARKKLNAPAQEDLDAIGRRTWTLFYIHEGTFALGVVLLAIALLLTYGCKLA